MSWRKNKKSSTDRGYGGRWQKARITYLRNNPFCVLCRDDGVVTAATVVDHIKPHEGNQKLFWNPSNWQGLCDNHHSSYKQKQEKSGFKIGCNSDGFPTGAGHHWNNKTREKG